MEFFCWTVAALDWTSFTVSSPRSRSHGAHASTSAAHDASGSFDIAWRAVEIAAAIDRSTTSLGTSLALGAQAVAPGSWLDGSGKRINCLAHSFGFYAGHAIPNVAWNRTGIVSRDRTSFLVAGSPAFTRQLEMA